MNIKANCITIPSSRPFLDTLAAELLKRYENNPLLLAGTLVLLPNRRSCRALKEAFLRQSRGRPCLLPDIQPLGELPDQSFGAWQVLPHESSSKVTLSVMRRQLLLTRMVMAAQPTMHVAQAVEMAGDLAELMDEAARHDIAMNDLEKLVPDSLSAHWQKTLDFLKVITTHWPAILHENGWNDPVAAQHEQLRAVAAHWRALPPTFPVIAAGSTGSQPATAELLTVIARLPTGMVVLPAVDLQMEEEEWRLLPPTHPQYALSRLLAGMNLSREELVPLGEKETQDELKRQHWISHIFAPPEQTASWHGLTMPDEAAVKPIRVLTAATQQEEARMIAVVLREALQDPAKTAALVTPDRSLAMLVSNQMKRFGIDIDDSAGLAVMDMPEGVFLQLVTEFAASDLSPVALLALLRHPLCAVGLETAQCRNLSRRLELVCLRGVRRFETLEAMAQEVTDASLKSLLGALSDIIRPLARALRTNRFSLFQLMSMHLAACEAIARTDAIPGDEALWQKESGRQLCTVLTELLREVQDFPEINPQHYAGWLRSMLSKAVYRPAYGKHPRLAILSPMEARLQSFDCLVLGGLNEGVWPAAATANAWMSRPMKHEFGLPPSERLIGQAAHDFYQLMGAREIFLSRARKVDGTVQVPSRWLVRMQTLIEGLSRDLWQTMQADDRYRLLGEAMDAPAPIKPLAKPEPTAPAAYRPKSLSVTQLERFANDRYACYAETILRLRPLDELDEEPSQRQFGMIIHKALEQYVQRYASHVPENLSDALLECGRVAFAEMMKWPAVHAIWWPRFEALVPWIAEQEKLHRALSKSIFAEQKIAWRVQPDNQDFKLTARIDRVEYRRDGSLAVIDYKTGAVPTQNQAQRADINQLALYAVMLRCGRADLSLPFTSPDDYHRYSLHYWRLASHPKQCANQQLLIGLSEAEQKARLLVEEYCNPDTVFASPEELGASSRYDPYEHLCRREEWGGG